MKKEIISSRQNPKIKSVCALEDKKARRKSGLFRFDGIKLFSEALGRVDISSVYVRVPENPIVVELLTEALSKGHLSEDRVVYVAEEVFSKLTEESSPEGIVTVAVCPDMLHRVYDCEDGAVDSDERILLAESLRDPGNLGTVMRSCAALGIDRLIISDDCADLYNSKTVRSAMGAIFKLPTLTVRAEELPSFIGRLRADGRRVYGAALREDALNIGSMALRSRDCFVIGNEGHGLSDRVIEACDATAIIPMAEGNESLNAAAAATICIWETVRAEK